MRHQDLHHTVRCERLKRFLTEALPASSQSASGDLARQLPQPLAQHVATCDECTHELHQHTALHRALANHQHDLTPRFAPEHYAQQAIAMAAHRAQAPTRPTSRLGWAAMGALAASLVIMLVGQLRKEEQASLDHRLLPQATASRQHPADHNARPQAGSSAPAQQGLPKRREPTPTHHASTTRTTAKAKGSLPKASATARQRRRKARRFRRRRSPRSPRWLLLPKTATPTFASGWHGFPLPPPPDDASGTTHQLTTQDAHKREIAPWPPNGQPPPPPPLRAQPAQTSPKARRRSKTTPPGRRQANSATKRPPPPPPLPKGATDDPLLRKLLNTSHTH